jgi:lipopolysaccharide assembly protein A
MTSPGDPGSVARPPADPGTTASSARGPARHHKLRRTRAGGLWVGMTLAAVVLLLLLVFILENGQQADVGYFGVHGHLPLGVALLLAAGAGALLVVIPGSARIMQLRRTARRHRAVDIAAARPGTSPDPAVRSASPPPAAQQPGDLGST